jgi:bifunctional oligoribonuclease and PAP phosphatase NrnA
VTPSASIPSPSPAPLSSTVADPSDLAEAYALAADTVARAPRDGVVLLACHVNPDGDALGSMLGFGLGLRQLGFTAVYASFPEPYMLADMFRFLPGLELLVAPADAPVCPDLGISFDAASVDRLGELSTALEAAKEWIAVDHHASNTGFGSVRLVDPNAAATAVLAAYLLDRLDVTINRDIAMCLYTGIVTDTGSFKFDPTTPEVLALAARLVATGVKPAEVARRVFDTRPFAAIRLLGDVLERTELDPAAAGGRGLVTAYATPEDLARHGQPWHVLEGFMDIVRTAEEADVACLVKPVAPGRWAVSLRSKGATDVSAVAVALGGGGHRLAAGFTGYGEATDVLDMVREQLRRQAMPE